MIALDNVIPAKVLRRDIGEILQKVGIAFLGILALLAAWVQGIRSRALVHRLDVEAQQRSNLEELSLAASGLAHETKNPLGIIRGLAQRLKDSSGLSRRGRDTAAQIQRALEATGGNKTRAAQLLGITRRGLIYKLKRMASSSA